MMISSYVMLFVVGLPVPALHMQLQALYRMLMTGSRIGYPAD